MNDTPGDSAPADGARYSIGELADAGGVSRRAVRFYVQRGLVAPPHGVGRGAHYDATHLAQLLAIKAHQEAGLPLDAIAQSFEATPPAPAPAPAFESWARLSLGDGVELHVRAQALTAAQRDAIVQAVAGVLRVSAEHDSAEHDTADPDHHL